MTCFISDFLKRGSDFRLGSNFLLTKSKSFIKESWSEINFFSLKPPLLVPKMSWGGLKGPKTLLYQLFENSGDHYFFLRTYRLADFCMMIGPYQGYLDAKICADIWFYKNTRAENVLGPKMAAGSVYLKNSLKYPKILKIQAFSYPTRT